MRDDNTAPTVYVDGYKGVQIKDSVAKINFFADHLNAESDTGYRKVNLRLAMSVAVLLQTHEALSQLVQQLKDAGLIQIWHRWQCQKDR